MSDEARLTAAERSPLRLVRLIALSVATGVLAWLVTVTGVVAARMSGGTLDALGMVFAPDDRNRRLLEEPWRPILFGPVVETCLFLLLFMMLENRVIRRWPRTGRGLFVGLMGVGGWLAHGGTGFHVGHGVAFGLLAALFSHVERRDGLGWAFFAAALAHITWNGTALVLYLTQ